MSVPPRNPAEQQHPLPLNHQHLMPRAGRTVLIRYGKSSILQAVLPTGGCRRQRRRMQEKKEWRMMREEVGKRLDKHNKAIGTTVRICQGRTTRMMWVLTTTRVVPTNDDRRGEYCTRQQVWILFMGWEKFWGVNFISYPNYYYSVVDAIYVFSFTLV